jgi:antitoxin (DNA-binding transcriptional repressor) of toxin-antitoxin stability system
MNDHPRVSSQGVDQVDAQAAGRVGHVSVESLGLELARLVERVLNGETVEIQKDGATIAVLTASPDVDAATRSAVEADVREARAKAWEVHKAELLARPAMNLGRFDREELYDDALKNRGH